MSMIEGNLKERLREAISEVLSAWEGTTSTEEGMLDELTDEVYQVFTDEEGIDDLMFEIPIPERLGEEESAPPR